MREAGGWSQGLGIAVLYLLLAGGLAGTVGIIAKVLKTRRIVDRVPNEEDYAVWPETEIPLKRERVIADRGRDPFGYWAYLAGCLLLAALIVAGGIDLAEGSPQTILGVIFASLLLLILWSLYVIAKTGEVFAHVRWGGFWRVAERRRQPVAYWLSLGVLLLTVPPVGLFAFFALTMPRHP